MNERVKAFNECYDSWKKVSAETSAHLTPELRDRCAMACAWNWALAWTAERIYERPQPAEKPHNQEQEKP
jgi:hypothetical protein